MIDSFIPPEQIKCLNIFCLEMAYLMSYQPANHLSASDVPDSNRSVHRSRNQAPNVKHHAAYGVTVTLHQNKRMKKMKKINNNLLITNVEKFM